MYESSSFWIVAVAVFFFLASVVLWWRGWVQLEKAQALILEGATVIDVDTPQDYAAVHHPGAKNIPLEELTKRASELGPRDNPIVVCGRWVRRLRATSALRSLGYRSVLDVGAHDW